MRPTSSTSSPACGRGEPSPPNWPRIGIRMRRLVFGERGVGRGWRRMRVLLLGLREGLGHRVFAEFPRCFWLLSLECSLMSQDVIFEASANRLLPTSSYSQLQNAASAQAAPMIAETARLLAISASFFFSSEPSWFDEIASSETELEPLVCR